VIQPRQHDTETTVLSPALLRSDHRESRLGDHEDRHAIVSLPEPQNVAFVLLPLCSLLLWLISLQEVDIRRMNDLGLISVLPPLTIFALILLSVSFCLALRQPQKRTPVLLLHLALLIFMLYGVTTLVEQAPRFSVLYRHEGYTEYILRTGTVDPNLDAYFNWPGFFILSASVTRLAGFHDIFAFGLWAPVFFNLIYLGPLYMIFTSATTDKRIVWCGLWFFYLTNWIGQDYFSPQGLNFFLYLVIIAILLRWFKVAPPAPSLLQEPRGQHAGRIQSFVHRFFAWLRAPDTLRAPIQPRQRAALLVILITIFAFVVFSHPLTPFFVLASVAALVFFRRCAPFWLPILMAIMTGAWIIVMAQPFLAGHLSWVTGGFGNIFNAFSANVSERVAGSPEHTFIAKMRLVMTFFIWGLACVGAVRRLRKGHHDVSYVLLAIAPFPLLVAQPYGGEMLLRIYLFALPPVTFFAASIFFPTLSSGRSRWTTVLIAGICITLLGGFLFSRYGNERQDYMTNAEVTGVHYLYSIARPGSIFIEGSDGTPWQLQDFEKYDTYSLTEKLYHAVATSDVSAIVQFIESKKYTNAYLIFTRSQKATAESTLGLSSDALDRLENVLLSSGKFMLVYGNPDAQILVFQGSQPPKQPPLPLRVH
jgi:hypothetical protein